MKNSARFLLLAAVAAIPLTAQMGGTPTTGSGGQTSVQANPGLGSGGGALGANTARPIYISGKVVIEDGSAVPPNVAIERICGGCACSPMRADFRRRRSAGSWSRSPVSGGW